MPYNLHRKANGVPAFQANINRDRVAQNVHIGTNKGEIKRYYNPTNRHYYKFENSPCKACHQRESQFNECVEIINSDERKHANKVKEEIITEHIECKCIKCVQKRDKTCKCKHSSSEKYEEVICKCKKCQNQSCEKNYSSDTVYKTILWCKKCETEIRNNRCRCKNMWYDS